MQKIFLIIIAIVLSIHAKSATIPQVGFKDSTFVIQNKINDQQAKIYLLTTIPTRQIETYLGRKLKFKEKLAIKILKYKAKHDLKKKDNPKSKKGNTSLILGIVGLVCLFVFLPASIPLGILAITNGRAAQKENPEDSDAKTGITLGIITLAIVALAIIAVIAFLSLFFGYR